MGTSTAAAPVDKKPELSDSPVSSKTAIAEKKEPNSPDVAVPGTEDVDKARAQSNF
mgnify:CR=1 FL=1